MTRAKRHALIAEVNDAARQAKPGQLKARMDLVPAEILEVAEVFDHGGRKHGDIPNFDGRSWRKEFAAAGRHMWKWMRGEELDPGSGRSHLAHAIARLLILLAMTRRGAGVDDRALRRAT